MQIAPVAQAQLEEANVHDARAPGGDDAVDERNPVDGGDEIVDVAGGGGDDTNMEEDEAAHVAGNGERDIGLDEDMADVGSSGEVGSDVVGGSSAGSVAADDDTVSGGSSEGSDYFGEGVLDELDVEGGTGGEVVLPPEGHPPGGGQPPDGVADANATGRRNLPNAFDSFAEFFAFFFLRGQKGVTQSQFELFRLYEMDVHPFSPPPPSLSYLRNTIMPRVRQRWGLPLRSVTAEDDAGVPVADLWVITPRDHVTRDFLFRETFDLFHELDKRSEEERDLHPEYVDSRFFQDRPSVLRSCPAASGFSLTGRDLFVGDRVDVSLIDGGCLHHLEIIDAFFAGYEYGVDPGPAIHAGDFVVALSSGGTPTGLLVSRFWRAHEHGSLFFWHTPLLGGFEVDNIHPSAYAGLCTRVNGGVEGGALPVRRALRTSSAGSTDAFTVSLAFFSDDFCSRHGSSTGGVYMSYMTWPYASRVSRGATRTISLSAPGVNSDHILSAIRSDLAVGTTDGWLVKDPSGADVRVFVDVAFFVGDYVQVGKTSKLRGHQARSPCPLCRYMQPLQPGSQYAQDGSSADTSMVRTSERTTAVSRAVRHFLDA